MSGGGTRSSQLPTSFGQLPNFPSQSPNFSTQFPSMAAPRVMSPFGMMNAPPMDWMQLMSAQRGATPATPAVPATATSPAIPAVPATPFSAAVPATPATPASPGIPAVPATPATPAMSGMRPPLPTPTRYMSLPAARGPATMSGGGLAALASGRFLQGPGDGVSDDIPGVIHRRDGSQQEAALADGEFVIPARAVAAIGQGSSMAGARKLEQFVERVMAEDRKAGRGKRSQADKMLNKLA